MNRTTIAAIGLGAAALVALAPREALTDPAHVPTKAKPAPTQADLDRLEKKLADQQRAIEKVVRLQQQYLTSLASLLPDGAVAPAPVPAAEPEPRFTAIPDAKDKPAAKLDPKPDAKPDPKIDARPAPRVEVKKKGAGTIVGKIRGGAGDVFVYVEDVVGTAAGSAVMKQEGKQFVPHVMAVQKGTRVAFPNLDAVFHNVFSVTPDASFDLGSYRQGETKSVAMTRPGVVNIYCNMHPQMVGYILVVPSSLYVRAGQDGFYRLPNVPSGKHRIVAWSPNAKPVVSDVDVVDDEVVTVELEVKKGHVTPHTNKDGMPYGSYKD